MNDDLIREARETQREVTKSYVLKYGEDIGNHLLERLADALAHAHHEPSLVAASREALIDRVHRALWEARKGQCLSDDEWPTIRDQHGPTVGGTRVEAERITAALLAGPVQLADATPEQAWNEGHRAAVWRNPYVGNSRKGFDAGPGIEGNPYWKEQSE